MNFTSVRKSWKARLALSLFVLAPMLVAPAAFAHTHPEMMIPAADATVSTPSSIMIHFSGALEPMLANTPPAMTQTIIVRGDGLKEG